ncbi:AzlD domain-containing protein [Leptolyngbya sp. AN03gr2]|uniref:AzlD domain-containing protein n=1 Tax=unclassified Leptolyngbya TaxID=2650499 RepID=UPI003D313B8D
MNEVYLIVGMMGVTFAIRYAVLGIGGRLHLSQTFTHLLKYIPPAVLTAIVVPEVLLSNDQPFTGINPRLVGAIVAILASYRTQNLLLTIALGMLTFFVFKLIR